MPITTILIDGIRDSSYQWHGASYNWSYPDYSAGTGQDILAWPFQCRSQYSMYAGKQALHGTECNDRMDKHKSTYEVNNGRCLAFVPRGLSSRNNFKVKPGGFNT